MRVESLMISRALNAKYKKHAAPTTMMTMSYHGMVFTRTLPLRTGYIKYPMMTTHARKRASLVSGNSVLNRVIPMQ